MKNIRLVVLFLFFVIIPFQFTDAQSLSINTDGSVADGTAILDVKSSTKGMLIPRLTQAQRSSLANPATSLIIYQTDNTTGFYYNAGTPALPDWKRILPDTESFWQQNGNHIYNSNTGNVGIGVNTPLARLHVLDSSVLFSTAGDATFTYHIPLEGAGRRMMWYPDKAAFRAGYVSGVQWNDSMIGKYSAAFGRNTTAYGFNSMAMGEGTIAYGDNAFAMGFNSAASGIASVVLGYNSYVSGNVSFAAGENNVVSGSHAVAMGYSNITNGQNSYSIGNLNNIQGLNIGTFGSDNHIFGNNSYVLGISNNIGENSIVVGSNNTTMYGPAHAFGSGNTVGGNSMAFGGGNMVEDNSLAVGFGCTVINGAGAALGLNATANTNMAFAIGTNATASSDYALSIGVSTQASGAYSFAIGNSASAIGNNSISFGNSTYANGSFSTAIGQTAAADGYYATAMGVSANASGDYSTAIGFSSASGDSATAIGYDNFANGNYSMALGSRTTADGSYSTSMGLLTTASGNNSTAMGRNTLASGSSSTAMGDGSTASGSYSMATGNQTTASGISSMAMGNASNANADYSVAIGESVIANSWNSISIGKYNDPINAGVTTSWILTDPLLIVGNGPDAANKKNALVILKNGNTGIGINNPNAPLAFTNATGKKISLYESAANSQYGFAVQAGQLQMYSDAAAARLSFGYFNSGLYTERMYLDNSTGILNVAGTNYPSDTRYKKQVTLLKDPLKKIMAINGVEYFLRTDEFPSRNFSDQLQVGLLAQEVEKVLPQVVQTGADGYKAIDYAKMVPLLVEAIKEQQRQIDKMKKQLEKQRK